MGAQFYTLLNVLALTGVVWGVCEYVYARKHPDRPFFTALALFAAPLVGGCVLALALIYASAHIFGQESHNNVVLRGFAPMICLGVLVPLWRLGSRLIRRNPR
jgi:hypothetical protein